MVSNTNILTLSQNSQLFAIKQTSRALDIAQTRVATGNRVNSPIDNPQNYFTAFSLSSRASDLGRVLDNITQGISVIQGSENARGALSDIINLARSTTQDAIDDLKSNQQDLGATILADNPVVYFRLDETSGTTATNLGSGGTTLNGTYSGSFSLESGALTFSLDNASVRFDGSSGRVDIPNDILINTDPAGYSKRTVELTFQADTLGGKQVLFEEGGTGNAIALYLDNDRIYYAARDSGDFGPFDISAQIEANKTYQAAFVLDSDAATFTGYLDGEIVGVGAITKPIAAHGGAVAIGRNAGGTYFHDGAEGGNGEYFDGRISDFALYNTALTQSDLQARYDITQLAQADFYQQEVTNILSEVDSLIEDSAISGINLLNSDNLRTNFTLDGSSNLITEGADLTSSGLGLETPDFSTFTNIDKTLFNLDDVDVGISAFGTALSNDLSVIQTRESFTESTINTLNEGSDNLTQADVEEESANLLALQLQQQIQIATLSLSTQGSNIGDFLGKNILLNDF